MLVATNATVNTVNGINAATGLTAEPVYIGPPSAKEALNEGGIVRYVMMVNPGKVIRVGDVVYIQTFSANTAPTTKKMVVFSADIAGALGMEHTLCVLGEKVQG